ncbi:hypothetical protein L9F63_022474, partial [Diploptera punctata]
LIERRKNLRAIDVFSAAQAVVGVASVVSSYTLDIKKQELRFNNLITSNFTELKNNTSKQETVCFKIK